MIHFDFCIDCERESLCQYPCSSFLDELDKSNEKNEVYKNYNPVKSSSLENENPYKTEVSCDKECLRDYLNLNVEDDEWLEILDKKLPIEEVIDKASLYNYMEQENQIYCELNNLCPECRSPLVEYKSYEEVWGSKQLVETYLICPKC